MSVTAAPGFVAFGLHAAETKAAATREVADRFAALKETFLARDPAGITPVLETRVIEASELVLQRRATTAALEARHAVAELNQQIDQLQRQLLALDPDAAGLPAEVLLGVRLGRRRAA